MKRREFLGLVGGTAASWSFAAHSQQASTPVLGLLSATDLPDWADKGIRAGLSETGFVEGRNLTIVRRSAEGQFDRLQTLASELLKSRVDVILAIFSPVPARAAKAITAQIPIVFAYGGDPVADGLVESLSHPGGNVTGATFIGTELLAKRMELMHEILPQATNVALLLNPKGTLAEHQIADATTAAQKLGRHLQIINASTAAEIDAAFAATAGVKLDALIVGTDPFFGIAARDQILRLTKKLRIPAIFNAPEPARDGALIGYGPSRSDTWRQAAIYVGRILKGEKPSDLPVMQPTKFELTINLKTARDLGIVLSPSLLARADEVIE
jgi:putative tryptophan/tyrosine transport system substrate-binding protein